VRPTAAAGICETSAASTCLAAPLDTSTGYASYIVRWRAGPRWTTCWATTRCRTTVHQSNFAEDRIAYPAPGEGPRRLPEPLRDNTPMVNLRMTDTATELQHRATWNAAVKAGQVTAYRVGSTVTSAPRTASRSPPPCLPVLRSRYCLGETAFRHVLRRPAFRLGGSRAAAERRQPGLASSATPATVAAPATATANVDRAASHGGCRCPQAPLTRCRLSRPTAARQR